MGLVINRFIEIILANKLYLSYYIYVVWFSIKIKLKIFSGIRVLYIG